MPCRYFKIIIILIIALNAGVLAQSSEPQNIRIEPVKFFDHQNKQSRNIKKSVQLEAESKKSASAPAQAREENLNVSSDLKSSGLYWLNTYNSRRNAYFSNDGFLSKNERNDLSDIANQGIANAESSFEANYIKLRETRNSDQAYRFLRRANELSPNNIYLYVEKAWQAERFGNSDLLKSNINNAYNAGQVSAFLTKISSFILKDAQPNSIIITNGENDTYPFWYLSNNKGITVISLSMLEDIAYVNKKLKESNSGLSFRKIPDEIEFIKALLNSSKTVYLSWGIRPDILSAFKNNLYPLGPMLQLSSKSIDNVKILKQFYLNNEFNKYLLGGSWKNDKYAPFAKNLLPGIQYLIDSNTLSDNELNRVRKLEKIISDSSSKPSNNGR